MNWLDVVLGLILLVSVVSGLRKGFAKVGIGLAASILGLLCGLWFYGMAGAFFEPYVKSRGAANLVGFLLILLAFLLAGALVGWLVAKILKLIGLSWLDRLAGGAFGAVRGIVIGVAVILGILAFSAKKPPDSIVGSRLAPYFVDAARTLAVIAPKELKDGVEESYHKARQAWRNALEKGVRRMPSERL